MIRRLLYFGYYLKELDREKFLKYIRHTRKVTGKSFLSIGLDVFFGVMRYNISILEYFQFRFFATGKSGRDSWAGTGYMYEYQRLMNPAGERHKLSDKVLFLQVYKEFVHHDHATLDELQRGTPVVGRLLQTASGRLVLKPSDGQCGRGIKVLDTAGLTLEKLIAELQSSGTDYVEPFILQHENLNRLSPAGLNTVRIITQLNEQDEVNILGARLRITVNNVVDNLAAGNIAASIDEVTGRVNGPGVYGDMTIEPVLSHPVTGLELNRFQVPFWSETVAMVRKAALTDTGNRSIGWDVAITDAGPELIEGNHDWCKLVFQLPVQKGLKGMLEPYRIARLQAMAKA